MTFSEDGIRWAKAKYSQFKNMHGFPENDEGLTARAKALLRIAHPVVVAKRYKQAIALKAWEDAFYETFEGAHRALWRRDHPRPKAEVTDLDWLADWDAMEAATIDHPKHGRINPVDWLIEQAIDKSRFCPLPPDLREIADGPFGFECADGVPYSGISAKNEESPIEA